MPPFTESLVEEAALSWLSDLGYTLAPGPDRAEQATLTIIEQAETIVKDWAA